jgi:PTH1 family peptidyl-tRNA hydrolase
MDYLIVGLGNPGDKYSKTRHNIGFDILDYIAKENNLDFKSDKFVEKAEWIFEGKKVLLIKPQTFMNLSGKAVLHWKQWYKIPLENILILTDDIALPVGKIRLRPSGSNAGHNGLKDIENVLGGQHYARLKFGVGNNFPPGKQSDFVLSRFSENDRAEVNLKIEKAAMAVNAFIKNGIEFSMAQFN